jgi:hypothetical protein
MHLPRLHSIERVSPPLTPVLAVCKLEFGRTYQPDGVGAAVLSLACVSRLNGHTSGSAPADGGGFSDGTARTAPEVVGDTAFAVVTPSPIVEIQTGAAITEAAIRFVSCHLVVAVNCRDRVEDTDAR